MRDAQNRDRTEFWIFGSGTLKCCMEPHATNTVNLLPNKAPK